MIEGRELYELHYDAMADHASVSIEKWEDLSPKEQVAWEATASEVSRRCEERLTEE